MTFSRIFQSTVEERFSGTSAKKFAEIQCLFSGLKVYTNVKVYVVADSLLSVLKMLPIYFNDGTAIGGSNVQNVSSHFLVLTGTGAVADVTDSYTVNPTKLVQDQRPISLTTGPIDAPGGISR